MLLRRVRPKIGKEARVEPTFVLGAICVAVALIPLLIYRTFYVDWFNHVWLIGHFADFFSETNLFSAYIDAGVIETGFPILLISASIDMRLSICRHPF